MQVGLYTCMVPMAVYALLGSSRILSWTVIKDDWPTVFPEHPRSAASSREPLAMPLMASDISVPRPTDRR